MALVGDIIQFGGASAPSGRVLCDGSSLDSVANTQYAALFGVIGTTYGGTGANNFNVPNIANHTIVFEVSTTSGVYRKMDALSEATELSTSDKFLVLDNNVNKYTTKETITKDKITKPKTTTITDAATINLDWNNQQVSNSKLTTARSSITVSQSNILESDTDIPYSNIVHRFSIKLDTGATTVSLTFSDVTLGANTYTNKVRGASTSNVAELSGSAGDVFILQCMFDGFDRFVWVIENTTE